MAMCFNPLDRGNLYQIPTPSGYYSQFSAKMFQSPISGKFVSNCNMFREINEIREVALKFQSPRSGKFVSN